MKPKVLVWVEGIQDSEDAVKAVYPNGIANAIASFLSPTFEVSTAGLNTDDEHGLSEEVLKNTDVLLWWGHIAHDKVKDEVVQRVHKHVIAGMGIIVLHSGHLSKILQKLTGTTCSLKWREGDKAILWNVAPHHPITDGIGENIYLPQSEMYGEYFDIPQPDELIFVTSFGGGEVFRGAWTLGRGAGKLFYFHPGHETYPIYYDKQIQKVIINAINYTKRHGGLSVNGDCPNPKEAWTTVS